MRRLIEELEWTRKVWRNGRHSNIPKCCNVWFYFRIYSGWPKLIMWREWTYKFWVRYLTKDKLHEYQYIRCPACVVRGRFNKMHICDKTCPVV